jgi:hypothetical protein
LKSTNGIVRGDPRNIIKIHLSLFRTISNNLNITYLIMFKWNFQTKYHTTCLSYHTALYQYRLATFTSLSNLAHAWCWLSFRLIVVHTGCDKLALYALYAYAQCHYAECHVTLDIPYYLVGSSKLRETAVCWPGDYTIKRFMIIFN